MTNGLKLALLCIFGVWVTDPNTPFRLMQRDLLDRHLAGIPKDCNLPNVLLTVSFVRRESDVKFPPITFRPRQGGVNSINAKNIARIGWQAIKDFVALKNSSDLGPSGLPTRKKSGRIEESENPSNGT